MFENLSIGHLLVVLVIFLLLFGAKRIPEIAGSLGQGIQSFKKSMTDATSDTPQPPQQVASARDSVPLNAARPSSSTAVSQNDDVAREPKRLF